MTMRGIAAVLAGLVALTARADTYPRQAGIKVTNYTFDITLNDGNDEFIVQDTVDVQFLAPGVTAIGLDLCEFRAQVRSPQMANGFPDPCAEPSARAGSGRGGTATPMPTGGKGMRVGGVVSGNQALTFQHANDRLNINLPRAFQPGERFQFTVSYRGIPATGILVANNRYGDRGFLSNPWPHKTRDYLAVIDHPYAKAPVVTMVTAPRHYQVISNGRLMEQSDLPNDLRRTVWKESSPICPCLMSLGVAPFAISHFGEYHGIPLSAWVYPQERDVSFRSFTAMTQPILEFYIDHIGPYSFEKLAQVEANGINGGMELASSIYYGYGATGPGRQLIAHEMAHQWFGDSAAEKDWDDVWLSEGFATYFALLYQEFQDGRDAFLGAIKSSKEQAVGYALTNPDSTIVHNNLADFSKVISNRVQIYQGGAQALQNIRGVLGTDTFWAGIRLYYRRFQNGNADSDDLRHAMEDACADAGDGCPADGKDLAWLFQELLHRGGALQVQGTWHYDAGAKQVTVALDQIQTSGLYRMPIEVAITVMATPQEDGSGGGRGGANAPAGAGPGRGGASPGAQPLQQVHIMRLSQQHQVFSFPLDSEPARVALDPNAWVMMRATFDRK
jgi:aminopeptidase N